MMMMMMGTAGGIEMLHAMLCVTGGKSARATWGYGGPQVWVLSKTSTRSGGK